MENISLLAVTVRAISCREEAPSAILLKIISTQVFMQPSAWNTACTMLWPSSTGGLLRMKTASAMISLRWKTCHHLGFHFSRFKCSASNTIWTEINLPSVSTSVWNLPKISKKRSSSAIAVASWNFIPIVCRSCCSVCLAWACIKKTKWALPIPHF